jgi:hypothetical protein
MDVDDDDDDKIKLWEELLPSNAHISNCLLITDIINHNIL